MPSIAIVGAGIFVLTGTAAARYAGPAIMLSFVLGGIACFLLLTDRPEAYNLPAAPTRPSNRVRPALSAGLMAVAALALGAVAAFAGVSSHER